MEFSSQKNNENYRELLHDAVWWMGRPHWSVKNLLTFAWIPIVVFLIPMIQHERSVDWNLGEAKKQRDVLQTPLTSHLYQLTSTQRDNIAAEIDV